MFDNGGYKVNAIANLLEPAAAGAFDSAALGAISRATAEELDKIKERPKHFSSPTGEG